jgi:hypothetical protein
MGIFAEIRYGIFSKIHYKISSGIHCARSTGTEIKLSPGASTNLAHPLLRCPEAGVRKRPKPCLFIDGEFPFADESYNRTKPGGREAMMYTACSIPGMNPSSVNKQLIQKYLPMPNCM